MGPGAVSEPGRRGQTLVIRHWSRRATKQVRGFPREPQILPRGLDFRVMREFEQRAPAWGASNLVTGGTGA